MIKSAPFSFVRFEHPAINDYSLDIPYTLPALGDHRIGFHFIVGDNRPLDQPIFFGTADEDGGAPVLFDAAIEAVSLNARYDLSQYLAFASFHLDSIHFGATTLVYNRTVTKAEFLAILDDDWGVEVTGSYFVHQAMTIQIFGSVVVDGITNIFEPTITGVWHEGYVKAVDVVNGRSDCFTYALLNEDGSMIGYSNVFKPVDEEQYTSVFTYSCAESAFAFTYGAGLENIVRLPLYLKMPDWPTKRTVNRQSNGRTQLLSAIVEKQYQIETEHMPEVFHECLRVALLHDQLTIENKNIRELTVEVIESADYSAQWNDELKLTYAQGKGTLKVASFGFTNSNC